MDKTIWIEHGRFVDHSFAREVCDDFAADGIETKLEYDNRKKQWVVFYASKN